MKPCGDCYEEPVHSRAKSFSPEMVKAACLRISGLGCGNCLTRVKNSLKKLDGVFLIEVSLDDGLATVVFDPSRVSPVDFIRSAEDAGHDGKHQYWADVITVTEISEVLPATYFRQRIAVH